MSSKSLIEKQISDIEEMTELRKRLCIVALEPILSAFKLDEIPHEFKQSVLVFIEKLDARKVNQAALIAISKGERDRATFKYFCGICHSMIKEGK